jgi:hypothetical protein
MKHPEHLHESYWERVRDRAAEMGCDGCSMATGAYLDCCLEHDLHYRLGTTLKGVPITKADADLRFRSCMQTRSKLGWFSPMAWWRYWAVKWRGKGIWATP